MKKKCTYKSFYTEEFINNMLDKGWMPVEFNGKNHCIFEQCAPKKYICKLVFMNSGCKADYDKLYDEINSIRYEEGIKMLSLKNDNSIENLFYIIYEKEKCLKSEIFSYIYTDYNHQIRNFIISLIIRLLGGILSVFCFTALFFMRIDYYEGIWWKLIGVGFPIIVIILVIYVVKLLLMAKYIHKKFF